ncbi:23S rRNA pseudouridine(955/2504/2580) synthase RluC [Buchnera aphidicola (Hyadaphis tataricae)]|uniref:Pseudouridine synthase n=1 Tax=Buchnera aphidicola (Hyadaphis tataricae) TaxID=1241859 RepID=A0A4D6YB20_9GAMM|nr:23S rRNA pseudouridine(955/2504/2580) synthase RluC [Buchnera aphidicola]QCI21645.1 23S rRNA pseudouridine(955/2504/2580) synthase RluC [Buchnera aphidicola (Hyadaphis tataricae)]
MQYITLPVSIIYANKDMINQRLDNFIRKKYKKIPNSMIYRIIRTGKIRINKKRIKPSYKLKLGDILKIPPIKILKNKNNILFSSNQAKMLTDSIIYEDNDLLIINKPAGIAVHGGSGLSFGIIEYFRKLRPLEKFLELVHRIDRETSGVLMLAKKRSALISLHQQLRAQKIKKTYIALVHGLWPKKLNRIFQPLSKIKLNNTKKKVFVSDSGKPSETFFKIKKQFDSSTLLSIFPKTGRTHQIRVHTSYIGHPIFFDERYGNNNFDQNIKYKNNTTRLLLHATEINFIHPKTNHAICIKSPLDKTFTAYLKNMI